MRDIGMSEAVGVVNGFVRSLLVISIASSVSGRAR
jgi:hypothetical protein